MRTSQILSSVICGASMAAGTEPSTHDATPPRGQYREHEVRVAAQPAPEPARNRGLRRRATRALGRAMRSVLPGGAAGRAPAQTAAEPARASQVAMRAEAAGPSHVPMAANVGETHAGPSSAAGEPWQSRKAHLERIRDGFVARRAALDEQHGLRNRKSKGFFACLNCIGGSGGSRRARPSPSGQGSSAHLAAQTPNASPRVDAAGLERAGSVHSRTASSEISESRPVRFSDTESLAERSAGSGSMSLPSFDGDNPPTSPELEQAAVDLAIAQTEIRAESDEAQREQGEAVAALLQGSPIDSPRGTTPPSQSQSPERDVAPAEDAAAVQLVQAALSQAAEQLEELEQIEQQSRDAEAAGDGSPAPGDPVSAGGGQLEPSASRAVQSEATARPDHVIIDIRDDHNVSHPGDTVATGHLPRRPLDALTGRPDHIVIDIHDDAPSTSLGSVHPQGHGIWRRGTAMSDGAGPSLRPDHVIIDIEALAGPQAAAQPGAAAPFGITQVAASVSGLLRNLTGNQYSGRAAGLAASVANAALRDGSIVFVSTALREVVGYLVQRSVSQAAGHAAGNPERLRELAHQQSVASAGILAGVAGLNLASLVYNAQRDTGTARSVNSRAFNVAAIGAAGALAYGTGTLGAILPLLVKSVVYTGLRDTGNLFAGLSTNRPERPQGANQSNMQANWAEMLIYSVNQFVTNTLQGTGQAFSGTSSAGQAHSLRGLVPHLAAFAGANAAGEIADSVVYPILTSFFDHGGLRGMQALHDGIAAASNVRVSSTPNRPTMESAVAQLLGPFTGRTTVFTILYAIAGALSRIHPSHELNENGVNRLTTAIISLLTGVLAVPYITALDTREPPASADEPAPAGIADR